ncbi:hypothetical protein O6H91_01G130000 [Diphasiastrum complanatum]|uniref:Uncharacterized protein n=1 Tax=Diphasiastrum complanatum TaxID=34168 RepID=A0ACC2EVQ9_DIPCM|nr:hypothetical protein O6H91_01G130000 [Diphasiastrum complanatum]
MLIATCNYKNAFPRLLQPLRSYSRLSSTDHCWKQSCFMVAIAANQIISPPRTPSSKQPLRLQLLAPTIVESQVASGCHTFPVRSHKGRSRFQKALGNLFSMCKYRFNDFNTTFRPSDSANS